MIIIIKQQADRVISFHGRSTGGAKGPRGPGRGSNFLIGQTAVYGTK